MDISQTYKFIEPLIAKLIGIFDRINFSLIDSWWLTILIGVLLCFFGVKIFSVSVFWFGAFIGGSIGYGIGSSFFDVIGGVVCAILLGIICGFILRAVIRIGFFLGGLLAGGLIGTSILGNSPWVIGIIIISGILSVVFFKYFIITATSMWGAILLTGSLSLFTPPSFSQNPCFFMAIEGILFISGLLYQAVHLRRLGKSEGVNAGK